MTPKNRYRLSIGIFVPAVALAGAGLAQAADTSARSAGSYGQSASPGQSSSDTSERMPAASSRGSDTRSSASTQSGATPAPNASERSDLSKNGSSAGATQAHSMRASKIIGKDVANADGKKIGEIKDLMVDTKTSAVRYAVLSHGGVAGIGNKLFAYPMSMFHTRSGSDDLVLDVSKEKLEKAPGFESNKWPDWSKDRYGSKVDEYYGTKGGEAGKSAQLVRASELIGRNIEDRSGKGAGEIEDLVVNVPDNRVRFAVIDFNDSWSRKSEGKLVALPLTSLQMSGKKGDKLVIDESPDRIDMSHAFNEKHWPDFGSPQWRDYRPGKQASR